MLSGKQTTVDYILEQLDDEYGFSNLTRSDIKEFIWKVVGYIGTKEPLKDAEPATLTIAEHRALLPHDFYKVTGVREYTTGTMMYEISDLFFLSNNENIPDETEVITDTDPATGEEYYTVVFSDDTPELYRYKLQGNYIYTAFQTGRVEVAYKAFPVDVETGLPMIPDDPMYLRAVVSFVAERLALKMMLRDELSERKYELLRQDYLFNVGAARGECIQPDASRMEVLVNRWKSPHPYYNHFDEGFKYLGSKRKG